MHKRLSWLANQLNVGTTIRFVPGAAIMQAREEARPGSTAGETADQQTGVYVSWRDEVLVADDLVDTALGDRIITHEMGHAISTHAINEVEEGRGSPRVRELVQRMQSLFDQAKTQLGDPQGYWRTNLKEFVAEAWSNPELQAQLLATPADGEVRVAGGTRTLWSTFVQALRGFFGVKAADVNLLEELLYASENLAAASRALHSAGQGIRSVDPAARLEDMSYQERMRVRREYAANQDRPQPDSPYTQEQVRQVEEETRISTRPMYFGTSTAAGRAVARGWAVPLSSGGYEAVIRRLDNPAAPEVRNVYDDSDSALRFLRDNGITAKQEAQAEAQKAGVLFADEYAKASPFIRNIAQAGRRIALTMFPNSPQMADAIGLRLLSTLSQAFTWVASDLYFARQIDQAVLAISGENPQLALRLQNAARAHAAEHKYGDVAEAQRRILDTLREAGLDVNRFSQYRVARHTFERNKALRDQLVIMSGGKSFDQDTTGFRFNGLTGDAAARAYLDSLSASERTVFEKLNNVWSETHQKTLDAQLRSGLINKELYDKWSTAWPDYTPIKHHESSLVGRRGGGISSGSSRQEIDHGKTILVAFTEMEQAMKAVAINDAVRMLAGQVQATPTAYDAYVDNKLAKRSSDKNANGEDIIWTDADFLEENSLAFYEDGKRRKITFEEGPALQYLKARRNQVARATRALGAATHMMASTRTTFSPAFQLQAFAWDAMMTPLAMEYAAGGTLTSTEALRVAMRSLSSFPRNMRRLLGRASTGRTDDPALALYSKFGGGVAPGARSGLDETLDRVRRNANPLADSGLFESGVAGLRQRVGAGVGKVMEVLHSTEDLARFSAFQAYLERMAGKERGKQFHRFTSVDEAMRWAQDNQATVDMALQVSRRITGDFSDKGTSVGTRSAFMFFNPAIAGARQLGGVSTTRSGQLGMLFLFLASYGLAAGFLGSDDDEDDDGGSNFLRRRDAGRAFSLGGGLSLPVAPEGRMALAAGEALAAFQAGKMDALDAASMVAGSVVDTIFPLNVPAAGDSIERGVINFLPAVFQPVIIAGLGLDSFGRDTEIDSGLVRDAEGNRVEDPANFERGRARDPQWATDFSRALYDTTGVDIYPGRLYETMRSVFGSTMGFIEQAEDEGVGQALTRSYRSQYNEHAVRMEFNAMHARFEQALRQAGRRENALTRDPEKARALDLLRSADALAREVRIAGLSQNQLYQMKAQAKAQGMPEAEAAADHGLEQLNAVQSQIRGLALRRIKELGYEL